MEGAITKDEIIKDDKEYLEEYFAVCNLYLKKRLLINKLWYAPGSTERTAPQAKETVQDELDSLNLIIRDEEKTFWEKTERSKQAGKALATEEFISHFQLSTLERRIFLFLLYLEIYYPNEAHCFDYELVQLFDQDSSPVSKIQGLSGFMKRENQLLKNNIIDLSLRHCRSDDYRIYALSGIVIPFLAEMLGGKKKNYEELIKKPDENGNLYETVGCAKEPKYSLDQVVLKDELKEKVLFFLDSQKKLEENKTQGIRFLFYGPPGTGKSMLAEAVAGHLGKKLFMAEFPKIASRWFGDTDKKIARLFSEAVKGGFVLCIDEADTLLYSRNYAAQEHDIRFVNEMLQELDNFKGIVVLTTNMDTLLDPALERRLSLKVKFELPDEKLRQQIWKSHIPLDVKLAQDIDFALLARRYEFSGGYIRNAAQNALRRLSKDNRDTLTMEDLLFGANLEQEGLFVKENKSKIGFFANS